MVELDTGLDRIWWIILRSSKLKNNITSSSADL